MEGELANAIGVAVSFVSSYAVVELMVNRLRPFADGSTTSSTYTHTERERETEIDCGCLV